MAIMPQRLQPSFPLIRTSTTEPLGNCAYDHPGIYPSWRPNLHWCRHPWHEEYALPFTALEATSLSLIVFSVCKYTHGRVSDIVVFTDTCPYTLTSLNSRRSLASKYSGPFLETSPFGESVQGASEAPAPASSLFNARRITLQRSVSMSPLLIRPYDC